MARKYINPNRSSATVTGKQLAEARERLEAAQGRLAGAEQADPGAPGWADTYSAALGAVKAAARRVDLLEALQASQLERAGKRAAAVKAAGGELASVASALAASRDQVAAAAAGHLRALAALAAAEDAHNRAVASARAELARRGLAVRDDLAAGGADHAEGTLDGGGVRAGEVDWTPLPAGGVAAHALREVYRAHGPLHPLAEAGKYTWRAHEVESRADQLEVPTLASIGAEVPEVPRPPKPDMTPIQDLPLQRPHLADSGYVREVVA